MPNTFDGHSTVMLSPGYRFQWEQAQDCYVLLYPEGMVTLNSAAGEILKRVAEGEPTVEQIVASLKAAFNGADLEDDVYQFLEVAQSNGWIRFQ